jgi:fructose-1,6-bisphosphatase
MGMDTDFELYKGKSFKDLCKDIYSNQENRKEQIEVFISDLRPLIKNVNDAMIVVPLIKGYLDTANVNDDHLVKLAAIIQKIMTAHSQAAEGTGLGLTEEEKKNLLAEITAIENSDSIIGEKLTKEEN